MGNWLTDWLISGYVALDITHTIPEDSGIYTCRAWNQLGQAESNAMLNVDFKQGVHADLSYVAYQDSMYTQQVCMVLSDDSESLCRKPYLFPKSSETN